MNWTELSEDIHQYPIQSKSLPYVDFEQPDQNFVNKYFDKVYCINLAKREKKWESVKKRFDERDIIVDRFDAIDGKILLDQNGLTKNELGCISSHLTVIQDANNKGYNKILIFEDDVHFSNDFKTRIQLIKNLDWKLLYLGGSQYKWDGIDISENFYPSNNTLGTFAYAVDSEIYEDLISAFSKKTAPADALLASVQEKNKGKCFTIYPNIVIADVTTSDIRPPRNLNTHAEKMKWNLNNFSSLISDKIDDCKAEEVETESLKEVQEKQIEPIYFSKTHEKLNENVTLLIKSFMRKECVENLINSIRKFYPKIKIVIVDDSNPHMRFDFPDVTTYNIDFDSGLSAGRNFGVSNIDTEYFILLDDDFEFDDSTKLEILYETITKNNLDILGGQVIENGKPIEYFGNFVTDEIDNMVSTEIGSKVMDGYKSCQIILNFFIAKTSKIKRHKWNDSQKLAEHAAFFFEHRNALKVGYVDNVSIIHKKILEKEYAIYRKRGSEFFINWMNGKNINYYINFKNSLLINSKNLTLKKRFNPSLALKNLIDLDKLLRKEKIPYWIQDGTLLGYYREKNFIGHDLDADIGIEFKHFSPKTLEAIKSIGFEIKHMFGYPEDSFELSLTRFDTKIDIFFYYTHNDIFYHCAFDKNKRIDYRYEKFSTKEVTFLNHKLFAPADELGFILKKYGENWNIPDPKWNWAYSPKNHYNTGYLIDTEEQKKKFDIWLNDSKNVTKRVITYGTFDTFHYGHMELLRKAKQLGDYLVVGLSTDEFNDVKGKQSKFNYKQRYEWLKSISLVDEIIPETCWEQKELDIKKYNIDIMVMGDDWVGKFDHLSCRLVYLNRTPEISSTKIKSIIV
jgi:glycerol-3-phosphate cytidylyltransferase